MSGSDKTGFNRIIKAAGFSWGGIQSAFVNEAAFRQEIFLSFILIPLAFFLGETKVEIALMLVCVFLVLLVELINSAIEAVVDRISDEQHLLSGRAKDMGSAAVLIALINLIVVWGLMIFY